MALIVWAYILFAPIAGLTLLAVGIHDVPYLKSEGASTLATVCKIVFGSLLLLPFVVAFCIMAVIMISTTVHNHSDLDYQVRFGTEIGVERALDHGADPNSRFYTSGESVPARGNELTEFGYLAHHSTSIPESTEKLRLLIDRGSDFDRVMCPNCQYEHWDDSFRKNCSSTPLMLACSGGGYEAVELLLENGAEINSVNYCGQTALDIAEEQLSNTKKPDPEKTEEFLRIKNLLLSRGAKRGSEINGE